MYRYLDMKLPTSGYEILVIMHSPKQNNQKIVTTFSILKFKCHQSDSFCKKQLFKMLCKRVRIQQNTFCDVDASHVHTMRSLSKK